MKIDGFSAKDTFECGQCFRWNLQDDGSYIGVVSNKVIKCIDNDILCDDEEYINKYFDVDRDYESIRNTIAVDNTMKKAIEFGKGIRILNQDLWETIISFIISANNNIPRIKGIIDRLSKAYGKEMVFEGKKYYTFPRPEELKDVSVEDFRKLGLGFRDIRLYETTHMILDGKIDLEKLHKIEDFDEVRNILLELSGVGPKVADCILLFSTLKRFEAFPIDVWVRRVMNEIYFKLLDEKKLTNREIMEFANDKFGKYKGLAQQYLFYYIREHGLN